MQTQQKNKGSEGEGTKRWQETGEAAFNSVLETVKEGASDLAGKAKDVASDAAKRAQDLGERAVEQTSTLVRSYPLSALAIGFGVGVTVGCLATAMRK